MSRILHHKGLCRPTWEPISRCSSAALEAFLKRAYALLAEAPRGHRRGGSLGVGTRAGAFPADPVRRRAARAGPRGIKHAPHGGTWNARASMLGRPVANGMSVINADRPHKGHLWIPANVRNWAGVCLGDSDPPWLASPKAHCSTICRGPSPIVVALPHSEQPAPATMGKILSPPRAVN
jgi:hypothetical protein